MEKIIRIDGKDIKFKSTGATALRYRMQFGRDLFVDLLKLEKAFKSEDGKLKEEIENVEAFDLEVFYNLTWVFAKTADKTLPTPLEWLDTFDTFPLVDIIPDLMELIEGNLRTIEKN